MAFNPNDPLGLGNYSPSSPPPLTMPSFGTGQADSQAFQQALANIRQNVNNPLQLPQGGNPYQQAYARDTQGQPANPYQLTPEQQASIKPAVITGANSASATQPSAGAMPFWKRALNWLDKGRAVVDNTLADYSKNLQGSTGRKLLDMSPLGWGLDPLGVINAAKNMNLGQDVSQGWNNTQNSAHFGQVLDNLGWNPSQGNTFLDHLNNVAHGVVGFAGDVMTDPTTYLTLGAGGVAKDAAEAGLKAGLEKLAQHGIDSSVLKGVKATNTLDVANTVKDAVTATKGEAAGMDAYNSIVDAAKSYRVANQNNLINYMGHNILNADQLAKMPVVGGIGKALQKTEQTIGSGGAEAVGTLASKAGFSPSDVNTILKNRYGVSDASNLTTQQFQDFASVIHASNPDVIPQAVKDVQQGPDIVAGKTPTFNTGNSTPAPHINDWADLAPKAPPVAPQPLTQEALQTAEKADPKLVGEIADQQVLDPKKVDRARQAIMGILKPAEKSGQIDQGAYDTAVKYLQRLPQTEASVFKSRLDKLMGKTAEEPKPQANAFELVGEPKTGGQGVPVTPDGPVPLDKSLVPKGERGVATTVPPASRLDQILKQGQFVPDVMGKNAIQRGIGNRMRLFNTRTLGDTSSHADFINSAADHIAQSDLQKRGLLGQRDRIVKQLTKATKGLTPEELKTINYIGEKAFPNANTPQAQALLAKMRDLTNAVPKDQEMSDVGKAKIADWQKQLDAHNEQAHMSQFDPIKQQQLREVAGNIRNIYDQVAKQEGDVNALKGTLGNYMFHNLSRNTNKTPEDLQAIKDWMDKNNYVGRSMSNKSNIARTGFDSYAQLENAINTLKKASQTETDSAKLEQINSKLHDLQNAYDTNPVNAVHERLTRSARATANGNLIQHMKDMGLVTDHAKGNYDVLSQKDQEQLGLKGQQARFVHPEVKEALQRTNRMFTDKGAERLMDNLDAATNVFKTLAVTYLPSHQYTRWMGNVANATLGGAKPSDWKAAGALMSKLRNGTDLTPAEKKMVDAIDNNGVLSVHYTTQFDGSLDQGNKHLKNLVNWLNSNKVGKTSNDLLNYSDNLSRLALFMRGMQQYGGDATKASNLVKKFLFNYNELSGADKMIRRIVPFWSWTRNNLPLQLDQFLKQPRYYQTYNRLQQDLQGNHPIKDYGQDYLHIGGDYFLNPKLPLEDLTNYGSWNNAIANTADSLTPVLKDPLEISQNKNFFTGAPIDPLTVNGPTPLGKSLGYIGQSFGGGPASTFKNLTSNDPAWIKLMSLTTGKPQQFDPIKIAKEQNYLRKQALGAQRSAIKQANRAQGG